MEQRRWFYFILLNIDNYTCASFWESGFLKFQLYIEAQTTNQCFVCRNWKNTFIILAAEVKERFFGILHMLRIHTGLRKWSKTNVFDLQLKKTNPFDIHVPCINIAKSELLFEHYKMALNQEKNDIEVRNITD